MRRILNQLTFTAEDAELRRGSQRKAKTLMSSVNLRVLFGEKNPCTQKAAQGEGAANPLLRVARSAG
jgi:hypothetical protein